MDFYDSNAEFRLYGFAEKLAEMKMTYAILQGRGKVSRMTDYTITTELFKLNRSIETLIRKMDELTFALRLSSQRGLIPSPFERGIISELHYDTDFPIAGMVKVEYPKDGFTVNRYVDIFDKEEENEQDGEVSRQQGRERMKCQVYYCVPFKAHKNTTAGRVGE